MSTAQHSNLSPQHRPPWSRGIGQVGGALSIYLAGRLFDLSGSYTAIYLVDIALLLAAGLVSYAIQERCYALQYMASAPA